MTRTGRGIKSPQATCVNPMEGSFIALEGATGVGKTTLVRRLCRLLGAQPFYDPYEDNPFLSRLYTANAQEEEALAVLTELGFLALRVVQLRKIRAYLATGGTVLTDWSMIKQLIFATTTLDQADCHRVIRTCEIWSDGLPEPDLVIHMQANPETLLSRVLNRGRAMELRLTVDDLAVLSSTYDAILSTSGLPVPPLDFTQFDISSHAAIAAMANQIRDTLNRSRGGTYVPLRIGNSATGHSRGTDMPAGDVHRSVPGRGDHPAIIATETRRGIRPHRDLRD